MKLPSFSKYPEEFYRSLPKVDLHRHLEGSLRFETIRELARQHGMDLPATAELRTMVQIQEGEKLTFQNFLSKFSTLRLFYRSPEIISRITQEAIADAAADNVRYLELRFTPVALSKAQGFPLAQVMDWVIAGAQQAEKDYGVITKLIASVNRHESVALAAQVSYLAAERREAGIVGMDLAGNEAEYDSEPFVDVFQNAKMEGLHMSIHAGEWASGDNVTHAINRLGAERIGHGIRVLDSHTATRLSRDRQTPFEVCITSNYQSGVIADVAVHPVVEMLEQGLNVTINSDDPSISNIRLSDEYRLVCEVLGLRVAALIERVLAAAQAAFLPEADKERLVKELENEVADCLRRYQLPAGAD